PRTRRAKRKDYDREQIDQSEEALAHRVLGVAITESEQSFVSLVSFVLFVVGIHCPIARRTLTAPYIADDVADGGRRPRGEHQVGSGAAVDEVVGDEVAPAGTGQADGFEHRRRGAAIEHRAIAYAAVLDVHQLDP